MAFRLPMPTDAWVRWLFVPALVFVSQATSTTYLADFWHHLARGRAIVEEGRLLDHDIFTFTVAGQEFQDVNWLTQVGYFYLFDLGGLGLVRVVNALMLAVTFALLLGICRRAGGSLTVAVGVTLLVFVGTWQVLTIRPQTVSLFLFVILYDLLQRSPRAAWCSIPIMALWANVHGAFVAGLMLLGCFFLAAVVQAWAARSQGERALNVNRAWSLGMVLVGSVIATLINPYGWKIYQYVLLTSNRAGARGIDEWLPPSWDQPIGVAFLVSLALLILLIGLTWRRGLKPSIRELCLLVIFLPLASGSVRMAAWWLIVIAPMAASRVALLWREREVMNQPSLGAALTTVGLVLLMVLSLPPWQSYNPLLLMRTHERIEQDLDRVKAYLDERLRCGRVFCRLEWGEYLSWAFHPRYPVFMDGRIEIYPDDVWAEYRDVTTGQSNWQIVLDEYEVNVLVLDEEYHRGTGLWNQIAAASGWQRTLSTGRATVFERTSPFTFSVRSAPGEC